jgi:hypothetical protein
MALQRLPGAKGPPSEKQLRLKVLPTSIDHKTTRRMTLKANVQNPVTLRANKRETYL